MPTSTTRLDWTIVWLLLTLFLLVATGVCEEAGGVVSIRSTGLLWPAVFRLFFVRCNRWYVLMANRMEKNTLTTHRFNLKSIVETLKKLVSRTSALFIFRAFLG